MRTSALKVSCAGVLWRVRLEVLLRYAEGWRHATATSTVHARTAAAAQRVRVLLHLATGLHVGGLLRRRRFLLFFGLLLQFIVAHGYDGEDEIDEVEGAQEDDHHEEADVPRAGHPEDHLVERLPGVLRHQAERGEQCPGKGVKAGVSVVRVVTESR